jgi:hypothetical protein
MHIEFWWGKLLVIDPLGGFGRNVTVLSLWILGMYVVRMAGGWKWPRIVSNGGL